VFWIADLNEWDWSEDENVQPDAAYRYGYRYLGPVATPAEVAALRDLVAALKLDVARVEADAREFLAERDTLRARVAALEAAGLRALNYIENTETEHGIKLGCGDALRAALGGTDNGR
jgi:hypothetical protein